MGVVFGILAAIAWGVADYGTAQITRQVGVLRSLAWTQSISLSLITLAMLVLRPHLPAGGLWLVLIGMGVAHIAGTLMLYRAFAVGTLAIVGPVSASYTLVTALLSLCLSHHKFGLAIGAGMLCVLGGITLLAQERESKTFKGIPEALCGALCFGLVFWSLDQVAPAVKYLWPLASLRIAAFVGAYGLMALAKRDARAHGSGPEAKVSALRAMPWQPRAKVEGTLRSHLARPWIIGVALLDTAAWGCVAGGFNSGNSTVVTALSSMSHALTVLLAWLILKDRLSLLQWSGVAVVLLGVFLLSVQG